MEGLIHIYTGNGKGKTTAAIGLAVRAAAAGYNIVFAQFLKSWDTSEKNILEKMDNVIFIKGEFLEKFSNEYSEKEKYDAYEECNRLLKKVFSMNNNKTEKYMFVLDEIVAAYDIELIDRKLVVNLLENKPSNVEIVMTGRNPSIELKELADYISEIKMIKHPFEKGIKARKGIEY